MIRGGKAADSQEQPVKGLYRYALATALVTFLLLILGGGVTSSDVGMADPQWPTPPWYLIWYFSVADSFQRGWGFIVEHGHRAWGYVVGMMTMGLCGWLWVLETRKTIRWLGVVALAAVCSQGLLGGLRVRWDVLAGREMALVHGCLAQLIFALICGIAFVQSPFWNRSESTEVDHRLPRYAWILAVLVIIQLSLGAILRHVGIGLWVHMSVAVGILISAVLIVRHAAPTRLQAWARFNRGLILFQIAIGLATWLSSNGQGAYAVEAASVPHIVLATGHVGAGALLLAGALLFACYLQFKTSVLLTSQSVSLATVKGI